MLRLIFRHPLQSCSQRKHTFERNAHMNFPCQTPESQLTNSGTVSQQDFLRSAMARLHMTEAAFAARLGTTPVRVRSWLAPSSSAEFAELDPVVWKFIREIQAPSGTDA